MAAAWTQERGGSGHPADKGAPALDQGLGRPVALPEMAPRSTPRVFSNQLGNGMTVINAPTASNNAAVALALRRGTRDEKPDQAGLTALCTALLFSGTEQVDSDTLATKMDSMGVSVRTSLGSDSLIVVLQGPKDAALSMATMLAEAISMPRLDAIDIAAAKAALTDRISLADREVESWMARHVPEVVYAPGNPLSRPAGGDAKVLKRASKSELRDFHQRLFGADEMAIVVAGGNVISLPEAEKIFGGIAPAATPRVRTPAAWNRTSKQVLSNVKPVPPGDRPQSAIHAVSPAIGRDDPLRPAAEVLLNVLSGGMSARLFYEVRERRALCYHVRAELGGPDDCPQLTFFTLSHPDKIAEAIRVGYRQLQDLAGINGEQHLATAAEIDSARNKLRFARAQASETAAGIAQYCAGQFVRGMRARSPMAESVRWNKVDPKAVEAAAARLLRGLEDVRLVQTGPLDQAAALQSLIKSRALSHPGQELAS